MCYSNRKEDSDQYWLRKCIIDNILLLHHQMCLHNINCSSQFFLWFSNYMIPDTKFSSLLLSWCLHSLPHMELGCIGLIFPWPSVFWKHSRIQTDGIAVYLIYSSSFWIHHFLNSFISCPIWIIWNIFSTNICSAFVFCKCEVKYCCCCFIILEV